MANLVLSPEAVVSIFALVALPIVILMTVWTVVTMVRILFPERELPFDPSVQRTRARQRGKGVRVRFRDLVEDQRHAEAPAMPETAATGASSTSEMPSALAEDLWLRRN